MTIAPLPNENTAQPPLAQLDNPTAPVEDDVPFFDSSGVGAIFGRNNPVASGVARQNDFRGVRDLPPDPEFNWVDEVVGTKYEPYSDSFFKANNREQFEAVKSSLDRQLENQKIEDTSGWGTWIVGQIAAEVANPVNFIPGGAAVKGVRGGYSVGRTALSTGASAGVSSTLSEASLQTTQDTRTALETSTAIGGSIIIGGLLGAGAAKLLSRSEMQRLGAEIENDLIAPKPTAAEVNAEIADLSRAAVGGGSEATAKLNEADLTPAGKAARAVMKVSNNKLFPGIQSQLSESTAVRRIYNDLVENTVMNERQASGQSTGQAVETTVKYWQRGAQAKFLQREKAIYKDAKKSGWNGTRDQFAQEVAFAARRGDEHPNAHVQKAAEMVRDTVFDPLLKRSELPSDMTPDTAMSYVTRLWNRRRLLGDERNFKGILRRYFGDALEAEFRKTDEIDVAERLLKLEDANAKAADTNQRLQKLEQQQVQRAEGRAPRLNKLRTKEALRRSALGEKAEPELRAALGGDDSKSFIETFKDAKRETSAKGKSEKFPMIGRLRRAGGVKIGSQLDDELRAMDVTPQSFPGLFKKEGGLTDVDNFEADDLFRGRGEIDGDYIDRQAFLDAVSRELAGDPARLEGEIDEGLIDLVDELLESVGLDTTARVGDVRKALDNALKAEKQTDALDGEIPKLLRELEEYDKNTDAIKDRVTVTKAEANALQKEVDDLNSSLADVTDAQRRQPRVRNILKMARFKRDLADARLKRSAAANRRDAIARVDGASDDLNAEFTAKSLEVDNLSERIVKLEKSVEDLERFMPKRGMSRDEFVSGEDIDDYLNEVSNNTFNNLIGRGDEGKVGDAVPAWMVPIDRGPLKERSLKIDDALVEKYLENDIRFVVAHYVRTMGAEVELQRKFGRGDMADQFREISDEYDQLRAAAGKIEDEKARVKETDRLFNAEKLDKQNLAAFRDQIRGTYRVADRQTSFGKAARLALTWNYVRLLGGVTLSSVSDAARVISSNGISNFVSEVIAPLATHAGRNARKIAKQEAREMGSVVETWLNSRLATLAELDDPYAAGSPFERLMANASTQFTHATGLTLWNDVMKSATATMTQNRIFRNSLKGFDKLSAKESRFMARLGIDAADAATFARNFQAHGAKEGPTFTAGLEKWGQDDAIKLSTAINKLGDQTVVTKGVGDTPLFMQTNGGRLLMQFKSFAIASHQRVLISGLQDNHASLLSFLVGGTALGMMASYLKMIERGDYERAEGLVNNPGRWVADGLDRTGIFAVPFDILNTADKVSSAVGGPAFGTAAIGGLVAQDDDASGGSTRYASRNPMGAILGPSAGVFQDLSTIMGQIAQGDVKKSGANAMIRQIPGATLPIVRPAIHHWAKPMLQDAVN